MLSSATANQRACKHKYTEQKQEPNGYWFRCMYCGHKVFGAIANAKA